MSETQERLKQIRERARSFPHNYHPDFHFLLSQLNVTAIVDGDAVCTCSDLTDSEDIRGLHYEECPALAASRAATQMRTACVETIRALRPSATGAGAFKDAAIKALGAVTLDQGEAGE